MQFSRKALAALAFTSLIALLGASYGGYIYGMRQGQTEGYAWGIKKGRVEAARQLPQPPINKEHPLETLLAHQALSSYREAAPEVLERFAALLNQAPSPCRRGAKKGQSLATALIDPKASCPAYASSQVALAWAALNSLGDLNEALAVLRVERRAAIDTQGRPAKGEADAPVILVEWSDFECPYCRRASPLLEELLKRRSEVKVVYKHLPLSFHKAAMPAALAVEAASEQGRFWEMHDALFAMGRSLVDEIDSDEPVPKSGPVPYEAQAKAIGLDLTRYQKDFRSDEVAARVQGDMAEAKRLGVRGTPTFFVAGRRVEEGMNPEVLSLLVDKALGEAEGRFSWDLRAPSVSSAADSKGPETGADSASNAAEKGS